MDYIFSLMPRDFPRVQVRKVCFEQEAVVRSPSFILNLFILQIFVGGLLSVR